MSELIPGHPEDAGLERHVPDSSHFEGAELLANEARPLLRDRGFDDDEILEWAETYIADEGSGDIDSFIEWIAGRQGTSDR